MVTAMRASASTLSSASSNTASIIGISASAWPRSMRSKRRARIAPSLSTAAEQARPAQSKPSTLTILAAVPAAC